MLSSNGNPSTLLSQGSFASEGQHRSILLIPPAQELQDSEHELPKGMITLTLLCYHRIASLIAQ